MSKYTLHMYTQYILLKGNRCVLELREMTCDLLVKPNDLPAFKIFSMFKSFVFRQMQRMSQ